MDIPFDKISSDFHKFKGISKTDKKFIIKYITELKEIIVIDKIIEEFSVFKSSKNNL
jgi:hypothetical protein